MKLPKKALKTDYALMKTIRFLAIFALSYTSFLYAEDTRFTKAVTPDDFALAGLSKLSPLELYRLDQLIEQYKSGALTAAKQETAKAEARAIEAEKKAAIVKADAQSQITKAKDDLKKSSASLMAKAKNLLTPGTTVEYKTTESRIVGSISGWEPHSVFALENGEVWAVADASQYVNGGFVKSPKVILKPARFLGGFQMEIVGMGTLRVRLIGSTKE